MMTRKIAIERLRTVGTLRDEHAADSTVSLADATDPLARRIAATVIKRHRNPERGQRMLAPSTTHMVLP